MKEEIVKMLDGMSGRYNYHTIFQDWVATMAISIQNTCSTIKGKQDEIWKDREKYYMDIMRKYTEEEQKNFAKMLGMLTETFEEGNITDVLGEIYMSKNSGNSKLGQFFTPFHLSELCARMAIEEQLQQYKNEMIEINEPSTGGGGMMIAAIKVLKERGIDYQRKVHIVAQDLDWNGVYMTYVQLSLLGANATVVQGNTLSEPYSSETPKNRIFLTPMKMGVLL
ncbi:MAG: N-6 DNA methylase [Clostridiales bacterium]|nr:N-6 DNA methylase [Clostridiales bacterium]